MGRNRVKPEQALYGAFSVNADFDLVLLLFYLSETTKRSEGSLPSGAKFRATTLYSVGPWRPDHDAVMRIGGEAPGRRAQSRNRCQHHGLLRVTVTSDRHRIPTMFCSSCSESYPSSPLTPLAIRRQPEPPQWLPGAIGQ